MQGASLLDLFEEKMNNARELYGPLVKKHNKALYEQWQNKESRELILLMITLRPYVDHALQNVPELLHLAGEFAEMDLATIYQTECNDEQKAKFPRYILFFKTWLDELEEQQKGSE